MWDVLSGVAKMAWDVMSGVTKTAWDGMYGVTKTAWDVLSGTANLCGIYCPGCQKNGMGCFVPRCFVRLPFHAQKEEQDQKGFGVLVRLSFCRT